MLTYPIAMTATGLVLIFSDLEAKAQGIDSGQSDGVNRTQDKESKAMHPKSISDADLPEGKRTKLKLYVTSAEAYEMSRSDPDNVKIIDVRTPEEFAFVGHAERAWYVPLAFVTYQRDAGKTKHSVQWNLDFVEEVKGLAEPDSILLITCRSGDRGAMAVNQLAAAGFTKAFNIVDGVEGDKVDDPGSVFHGKRMRNGWKNSAPWVYGYDPEKIILKESPPKPADP